MSDSKKTNPEILFDLRTLDIHLASGKLKDKQYEDFLKSLPDEEGNFETIEGNKEESSSSDLG